MPATATNHEPWMDAEHWQNTLNTAQAPRAKRMATEALEILGGDADKIIPETDARILEKYYRELSTNPGRRSGAENPGTGRIDARERVEQLAERGIAAAEFVKAENLSNGGFESFGDFLSAIRLQQSGSGFDPRLAGGMPSMLAIGQNKGSDPAGGFLVPDAYQRDLVMSAEAAQPWLSRLRRYIVPDGRGDVVMPSLSDRDKSAKTVGGLALTRMGETGTIPLSTLAFESRRAALTKAATRVRVSNELLQDGAIGFGELLERIVGEAVAMRQALDVLGGTGVGEPAGILNAAALYSVAKEVGQAADSLVHQNITKMFARFSPGVLARGIWLAHPGTFPALASLSLPVGTGGTPLFVSSLADDAPSRILGRPLFFSDACQLLGDKGDIMLIDPLSYMHIMKPLRIDMSRDFRFDTDETEFRIVLRDDGAPMYNETRRDVRNYEHSEFVTLAERA